MLAGGTEAPGTRGRGSARRLDGSSGTATHGRRLLARRRRDHGRPGRSSCSFACTRSRRTRTRRSPSSSATRRSATCSERSSGSAAGRSAPLPARLPRGPGRPRPDEPPARLGRLRRREHARDRRARRAPDRPPDGAPGGAVAATSWTTLYHGIYGRMYSLFLFTARCSRSSSCSGRSSAETSGRWAAWAAATLALLATQPYGVLVLAAELVYVAVLRARRPLPLRAAAARPRRPCSCSPSRSGERMHCSPPASRSGSASRARSSGLPSTSSSTSGTCSATSPRAAGRLHPAPLLAVLGAGRRSRASDRRSAALTGGRGRGARGGPPRGRVRARASRSRRATSSSCCRSRPWRSQPACFGSAPLWAARDPERSRRSSGSCSRHRSSGGSTGPAGCTPASRRARSEARAEAAEWLARTGREDDVLFGYEPTYLDAWEHGAPFGRIFVPRADAKLALEALEDAGEPLGHGVWVLDASDYVDQ